MILTVSESVNKVSKVNQSSFRFLLKMHLRKSPKKFAAVKVGICKFSSKSFSEKTCSYPWQHVQIFSDAMLSFLTLAIALAVPRGVSVLRVVLRAVPGGARLLRDIRPRRPRQQHPHFAGEKIIVTYVMSWTTSRRIAQV